MEMIIDATGQIAGRLASLVAKNAIKGYNIRVINSEKAIISGRATYTEKYYKKKIDRGDPYHGPFYPKYPDQIMKRMVRGMIDYKKSTGQTALKRVKVYLSVPEEFKDKKITTLKGAESKFQHKQITLGDLSIKLGANKLW